MNDNEMVSENAEWGMLCQMVTDMVNASDHKLSRPEGFKEVVRLNPDLASRAIMPGGEPVSGKRTADTPRNYLSAALAALRRQLNALAAEQYNK